MKIMFFNGGLANQMFQYIFYRYGQLMQPGEEWYLDDSFFFVNRIHNGYELEKVFGIRPKLLSEYFDKDVWEYMLELKKQGKSIAQTLLENGVDIRMISEYKNWREWNPFSGRVDQLDHVFEDWMVNINGNIYYNGYGISPVFFRKTEDVIRNEFVFPETEDEENLNYLKEIEASESCAMHIRRGDFVTLGVAGPDTVYRDMLSEMLKKVPETTVFLFSDDMAYCEEHAEAMGLNEAKRVVYVKGNSGETAYKDMYLMSRCKNRIVGNSSFSFMASLLSREKGVTITVRKDRLD